MHIHSVSFLSLLTLREQLSWTRTTLHAVIFLDNGTRLLIITHFLIACWVYTEYYIYNIIYCMWVLSCVCVCDVYTLLFAGVSQRLRFHGTCVRLSLQSLPPLLALHMRKHSSTFRRQKSVGWELFVARMHMNKEIGYRRPGQTLWCSLLVTSCLMVRIWLWCMIGRKVWVVSTQMFPLDQTSCVSLQGLLIHFLYAVEPGFYSTNWLFLGKTHLKLGEKAKAKEWLQKTVAFNGPFAGDEEDMQVNVACTIEKSISVSYVGHAIQAKF